MMRGSGECHNIPATGPVVKADEAENDDLSGGVFQSEKTPSKMRKNVLQNVKRVLYYWKTRVRELFSPQRKSKHARIKTQTPTGRTFSPCPAPDTIRRSETLNEQTNHHTWRLAEQGVHHLSGRSRPDPARLYHIQHDPTRLRRKRARPDPCGFPELQQSQDAYP